MAERNVLKIIIAGEGGQGVQTIGELLAEAAFQAGKQALYIPNFGVEQRGGVSVAYVQIADEAIGAPKFAKADLLTVLSKRSAERTKGYLRPGTIYLYEESALEPPVIADRAVGIQGYETIAPEGFAKMVGDEAGPAPTPPADQAIRPIGIRAAATAKAELTPKVFNIIILGAITKLIAVIPPVRVKEAIAKKFGTKFRENPELAALNFKAFEKGLTMIGPRETEAF
ncbi:MAG TPA: pyruvate oxidoreductase subunit gamma [Firmicutes bacterium]|nr:pyruvate oxidoreductase subunit gamma [Bacillota bacterium]